MPCSSPPTASRSPDDRDWWRQAVVYQVYPRSFADATATARRHPRRRRKADYLAGLGVDAVWLSPFYPSELADGGYDVADYRDVDPRLGTLADFDELIAALHGRGIKVVVDIVPNHSSDRHALVPGRARRGRDRRARSLHLPRGPGETASRPRTGPRVRRSTWEPVGDGQWYLHTSREQPDFNWDNPDVHEEFLTTLRFWSDRGVDGFRIDVAHGSARTCRPCCRARASSTRCTTDGSHPLWDRDAVHEIYREWRQVFDEYDPPRIAVAEAWVATDRVPKYATPEGLGQAFNFDLLEADFDAAQFRRS
jgi:alpha-glucosidase